MAEETKQQKENQTEALASGEQGTQSPAPPKTKTTNQKNDDVQKFKKILEYFAGHIRYLCESDESRWKLKISEASYCPEFLQSIKDSIEHPKKHSSVPKWYTSGQGYDGDGIQDFMEFWALQKKQNNSFTVDKSNPAQKICITVIGFATTDGAYLHFVNEGKRAESNATNINLWIAEEKIEKEGKIKYFKGFEVGPGKHSTYDFPRLLFTFKELGLGEPKLNTEQECNLRIFFEYFIEMRKLELNGTFKRMGEMGALTHKGKEQLLATHNMILTGAPGTGKTWSAKNIASWIICEMPYENLVKLDKQNDLRKAFENQCKIVQFHPSYDYTDFVEGLRPTSTAKKTGVKASSGSTKGQNPGQDDADPINKTIGFERVDGVFKEFCKKALTEWDDCHRKIEKLFNGRCITKDKIDIVFDSIIKDNNKFTLEKDNLKECFDLKDPAGANNTKKVVERATKKFAKKYVFIIDEINRGELSKIFGELFYSIDPGYRGQDGRVFTQYQNMVPKGDPFDKEKGGFYVPENVYIIGTMNDIDRSVESMDFAMRRRFSFIEVKANEREDMWTEDWKDLAKACMEEINQRIEGLPGLSSAYHIGPAYFKKLNDYMKQQGDDYPDFFKLWDNHLYGVIFEYLRGKKDVEKTMIEIQEVYLTALVKAVKKRFIFGGMWGSLLIKKNANANTIDPSINDEQTAKEYLNKISKSITISSINLVDLYNNEINAKTIPEREAIVKERLSLPLKLDRQIKYLMKIGSKIEKLS